MVTKKGKIEEDLVHLARVALSGRSQDVQMLLHRIAKGYRTSNKELSKALSDLLNKAPTRATPLRDQSEMALPVDIDTRFQLLRVEETPILDQEPVYTPGVESNLAQLIAERSHLKELLDAGLEPTRTVLFTGPPGVGKTMAARWVARELNRPLLILDLAAVMSSYLGRTGSNLRHVLDYAKSVDCILLLDELDAIAKRRDDRGEIGELKRLVTVLLQQVDDWPSSGLLIAATNHAELLDPAVWRRFEMSLEFPVPNKEASTRFIESELAGKTKHAGQWANALSLAFAGRSFSDIARELNAAKRAAALNGKDLDAHLPPIIGAERLPRRDRIALAAKLADGLISQRAAHELTGVSRDTIRKEVQKAKKAPNQGRARK